MLGLYGFYLLWVGLPMLMKVSNDKALPYAAMSPPARSSLRSC